MIRLELQPEIESRLRAEAKARGLSVDRYIGSLVAAASAGPLSDQPRIPERQREIDGAVNRIPARPPAPPR